MPDPKLKTAMAEIKAVLTKYDIAGVVVLASESHMEYLNHVVASWSCATIEQSGRNVLVRVRAKREDFPSKEAQRKCVSDTIGMIMGFADAQEHCREQMLLLASKIGAQVPFDHRSTHEDEP